MTVGGKGYIKFDLMPDVLSSLFPHPQAYELSTLTGTQVLLLVASETGHVYTFATRKLQPMITSETGKALIQTCLNSPDSPPRNDPSTDQRMSATGFEETDLTYQVSEGDSCTEPTKVKWLQSPGVNATDSCFRAPGLPCIKLPNAVLCGAFSLAVAWRCFFELLDQQSCCHTFFAYCA